MKVKKTCSGYFDTKNKCEIAMSDPTKSSGTLVKLQRVFNFVKFDAKLMSD